MGRISVASAKDKGRRLQKWVCIQLSEITGLPWSSDGKTDAPISSRPMGQSGTDIRLESHVLEQFPFSIECKAQEQWDIHGFIKQAQTNVLAGTNWLLICKKSRKNPIVLLDAGVLEDVFDEHNRKFYEYTIQEYTQDRWYMDKWMPTQRRWILLLQTTTSPQYACMDAAEFFSVFGKPPMKRKKKSQLKRKR